jgi:hypothetical protein
MQKCFYHTAHDAATTCIGCKMPVCTVCRDDGKNGFCGQCFKKVSSLGAQVTDTKKTGMVAASQKATMVKHMGRPTGPVNVSYCFHHFDVVASGTCHTCNRPFCPTCLNEQGVCTHCTKLTEDTPAERKAPPPRPQTPPRPAAATKPRPAASGAAAVEVSKGQDKTKLILFGVIGVLLVVLVMVLLRR